MFVGHPCQLSHASWWRRLGSCQPFEFQVLCLQDGRVILKGTINFCELLHSYGTEPSIEIQLQYRVPLGVRTYRLVQGHRPKIVQHLMSTPFFGDKALKFGTHVLWAPTQPMTNVVGFCFFARFFFWTFFWGIFGVLRVPKLPALNLTWYWPYAVRSSNTRVKIFDRHALENLQSAFIQQK